MSSITFSSLLALAITLITLGIDLIKNSVYTPGSVLVASGVALIFVAAYLFEKGIIQQYGKRVKKTSK